MSRFARFSNPSPSRPAVTRAPAPSPVASIKPADTTTKNGVLIKLTTYNNWAIGDFYTGGQHLKIKGEAVSQLKEGAEYELIGRMVTHPKYGESLDVLSSTPFVQLNVNAIEKYLSNNFKGVGPKTAKKMIAKVQASTDPNALEAFRQQILFNPWNIDWTGVAREGTFEGDQDDTAGYIQRDLATRLGTVPGMHRRLIRSISTWLYEKRANLPENKRSDNPVADAWNIFHDDPYEPARHVAGYGFRIADQVGLMTGVDKQAPHRLRSLVHFALDDGCNTQGHVYLTHQQLVKAVLNIDGRSKVEDAIKFGVEADMIVVDNSSTEPRYYTQELYDYEQSVANCFAALMRHSRPLCRTPLTDADIQTAFRQGKQNSANLKLDASQLSSIKSILTNESRLHVLTGGPGCGKTAMMETIVRLLNKSQFQFCAPTGKAAKVLTSRIHYTGHSASTIHSLFRGSEEGWQVSGLDPLLGDVLIVDESSMPSLELWDAVLNGMNDNMHLIVVGDQNQLPSIQAGQVLKDLLQIPGINHVELNEVHRNSGGILDVVREVCNGVLAPVNRESVSFSHGLNDADVDFPVVLERYLSCVRSTGIENSLLLMSRRQGEAETPGWNTTYANAVLQRECNPNAERIPGTRVHVNDRIIIKKNMALPSKDPAVSDEDIPAVRVVNGDTGTIRSYELGTGENRNSAAWLKIKLDDGRLIDYPGDSANYLDHAYALTVHAAQGSEYQRIIAVVTPGAPNFVNRNSLLTELSRAREKLDVFGNDADLMRIAATPLPRRNSALVELVTQQIEDEETCTSLQRQAA